jgi:hypothetical protein
MKTKYVLSALLILSLIFALISLALSRTAVYAYEAPFASVWGQFSQKNRNNGWLVLTCESHLQNVCEPDSDGIDSCGWAQIHQDGTWLDLEAQSGITGSFMDPPTAAKMLNWAMDKPTELRRWTCARLKGLVK